MTKKINYDLETGTASTLENFSKGRHNTTKDNEGKHFTDIKNIQFDGRTVWEFSHPTFVSVKRKSIVVCPRKAGHSSFRRALHVANEDFEYYKQEVYNFNQNNFSKLISRKSKIQVINIQNQKELKIYFKKNLLDNEMIICMGAGSISNWIREMESELK